jgi:predicted SAM-dependent methyltransferase
LFTQLPHIEYISADLYEPGVTIQMDLCAIPAPEETFDIIYCSHVLEHIVDDRKAMAELHRVLTDTGWCVVLVPIVGTTTVEDPSVTRADERERVFGQHDHVRQYGSDFIDRLDDAGFHVRSIRVEELVNAGEMHRFGLTQGDTLFFCTK